VSAPLDGGSKSATLDARYKQQHSALGISRLIAFAENNLARGLRLADLMA